jgi:membrane protease subunit (stomatin/prohibitin family)
MAIKWGTDSHLEYVEPTYKFPIKIGASGEMSIRADDSRKLLVKLVGTQKTFTHQTLTQTFRAFILTRVKSRLASQIKQDEISIFEIDENLERISDQLLDIFRPDFEDYGLSLERFFITNIVKPENDRTYQQFRDLHFRQYAEVAEAQLRQQVGVIEQQTDAQRKIIEAQSIAQKRALEGYTYQEERSFEVAAKMAENEAVGQMSNLGIGLGLMGGVGSAVGGMVQSAIDPAMAGAARSPQPTPPNIAVGSVMSEPATTADGEVSFPTKFCQECGAKIPRTAKFCPECGANLGGGSPQ